MRWLLLLVLYLPNLSFAKDILIDVIYVLESERGTNLYRPGDSSCAPPTRRACGHHQLTVKALTQIGYSHENYWILRSSKQWSELKALEYIAWIDTNYNFKSITTRYLAYNQGPTGISTILKVISGRRSNLGPIRKTILNNVGKQTAAKWNAYSDHKLAQSFLNLYTARINKVIKQL